MCHSQSIDKVLRVITVTVSKWLNKQKERREIDRGIFRCEKSEKIKKSHDILIASSHWPPNNSNANWPLTFI